MHYGRVVRSSCWSSRREPFQYCRANRCPLRHPFQGIRSLRRGSAAAAGHHHRVRVHRSLLAQPGQVRAVRAAVGDAGLLGGRGHHHLRQPAQLRPRPPQAASPRAAPGQRRRAAGAHRPVRVAGGGDLPLLLLRPARALLHPAQDPRHRHPLGRHHGRHRHDLRQPQRERGHLVPHPDAVDAVPELRLRQPGGASGLPAASLHAQLRRRRGPPRRGHHRRRRRLRLRRRLLDVHRLLPGVAVHRLRRGARDPHLGQDRRQDDQDQVQPAQGGPVHRHRQHLLGRAGRHPRHRRPRAHRPQHQERGQVEDLGAHRERGAHHPAVGAAAGLQVPPAALRRLHPVQRSLPHDRDRRAEAHLARGQEPVPHARLRRHHLHHRGPHGGHRLRLDLLDAPHRELPLQGPRQVLRPPGLLGPHHVLHVGHDDG
mmetsp:Transcript_41337/g.110605  ORF Transcript_41337/g.110605 Transcript_41337/m.110605 type:complete len:427 (+) Transcript_41337:460-1740(+)